LDGDAVDMDRVHERRHVRWNAWPLVDRIKIADPAVEKTAVVNMIGAPEHRLHQSYEDDWISVLPVVHVPVFWDALIGSNPLEAAQRFGVSGFEDLDGVIGIMALDEPQPRAFMTPIAF